MDPSPLIFLLSGTPGTGKTTAAKLLHEKYEYVILSLGDAVIQNNLYSGEDSDRDTKIVDPDKLDSFFQSFYDSLTENVIVECHYADLIDHPAVSLAIVLRCHPDVLRTRLAPRNYSAQKVRENAQAEFLGDSTSFMLEHEQMREKQRIFEIDTTNATEEQLVNEIHEIIQHPEKFAHLLAGKISWLSDESIALDDFYKD